MDIVGLLPSFGGLIWTLLAFVIALSVIVAIHEYGHYIVGRWSGIDAEVFSLGFGPVLWAREDKRGTRWQVAALPFGGYVKFLGDSSAASGKDGEAISSMSVEERRRTMHAAPLWARAATVAAGPFFNFALSFLIFAAILLFQGQTRDPLTVAGLRPLPETILGLKPGDELLAISGVDVPALDDFDGFTEKLPIGTQLEYRVNRDGQDITVPGPYPYPPIVVGLQPNSAAWDVGMAVGDVVLSVDGSAISAFNELRDLVAASDGKVLLLEVWRDGETVELALAPRRVDLPRAEGGFETRWLIGVTGGLFFEPETASPGVLASMQYGVSQTAFIVTSSLSGLWNIITGAISTCNLSGPIGIAQTSGAMASQGASSFIWFIAVLSTAVGLLNLFPIPVLDGGHLVFHAWEAVTGQPPSDKALRILMAVGLALIGTLMVFALSNDLFCP